MGSLVRLRSLLWLLRYVDLHVHRILNSRLAPSITTSSFTPKLSFLNLADMLIHECHKVSSLIIIRHHTVKIPEFLNVCIFGRLPKTEHKQCLDIYLPIMVGITPLRLAKIGQDRHPIAHDHKIPHRQLHRYTLTQIPELLHHPVFGLLLGGVPVQLAEGGVREHVGLFAHEVVVGLGLDELDEFRVETLFVVFDRHGEAEQQFLFVVYEVAFLHAVDQLLMARVGSCVALYQGVFRVLF